MIEAQAVDQPACLRSVRFSTRGLPSSDHIRLWEDHNAESLIALRCRTFDVPHLDATELNVDVRDLSLARVTGTPHLVERSPEVIQDQPSDAVACYLTLRGDAFFHHSQGTSTLSPGRMLICDADRPFLRGFSHGLEELVIRIPRGLFHDTVSSQSLRAPMVHDLRTAGLHGRTLQRLVSSALRPDDPQAADREVLLALLGSVVEGRHEDLTAMHFAAARTAIGERLNDPDLSAPVVAAAIGLSPRHLSRVFASAGVSVPRFILTRRLEHAHAALSTGADRSVEQVAAQCGFRSAAYFSHAFTKHFGVRASDVRRGACTQAPPS